MSLLTLKNIGKIYASEGSVAVGIRGVNLSFERGEFVAVTGKSGSGKSTLLNVISGIDTYEEGELYVNGEATSHYQQPEWDDYREEYISFIFQNYNIIDSFTVLENVELALLHIEDKRERRERALALIDRVGLSSHLKHKGSRLSGGQKQRTVIARALAKDSPIILADEPTGNLDAETSREIIELLSNVSRDKLVIVVTHNFEDVEQYATRHIRIFDGAVESDRSLKACELPQNVENEKKRYKKSEQRRKIDNGFALGKSMFCSRPRLSLFLCFLMLVGTLGIFLVTSFCGDAAALFQPYYMFNNIEGRVVLTDRGGGVIPESELSKIAEEYGAKDYLRCDALLDSSESQAMTLFAGENPDDYPELFVDCTYGVDFGNSILGRYPMENDEVLLYLPISYKTYVGSDSLLFEDVMLGDIGLKLVGVKYYYDNNIMPQCVFTEDGFRTATAAYYLSYLSKFSLSVNVTLDDGKTVKTQLTDVVTSFDMPSDKVYVDSSSYRKLLGEYDNITSVEAVYSAKYNNYNYFFDSEATTMSFERKFTNSELTNEKPIVKDKDDYSKKDRLIISDELVREIAESVLDGAYKQSSLFFDNDELAHSAAEKLKDAGYIAVTADTTYEPSALNVIVEIMLSLLYAFAWIVSILFLGFFINVCSSRTLGAFKGDLAIMRSMGIPVDVIRIGMYARMLISLLPAFLGVILLSVLIFTVPKFNELFTYLYAWQYGVIFLGMLLLTSFITHRQIKRLFGESVKRSLRGGDVA